MQNNEKMPITTKGLKMLIIGLLIMVAGYILLVGGGLKSNPSVFNYDMFDFRRLVAAPIVIICGIIIEIIAIMGSVKKK